VLDEALKMAKKLAVFGSKRNAFRGIKMALYEKYILMCETSENDFYTYYSLKRLHENL
jgi:hypothetical protein